MRTHCIILGLGLLLSTFASANCVVDPQSYLVFSLGGIQASSGDFQGLTGALGSIDVTDFAFQNQDPNVCANVVSGRALRIFRGGSDGGNVEAGQNVCIDLGHLLRGSIVSGGTVSCAVPESFGCDDGYGGSCRISVPWISPNVAALHDVGRNLIDQSLRCESALNQTPPSAQNIGPMGELVFNHDPYLPVQVFHVTEAQMFGARGMSFHGDGLGSELFVVNIESENVSLNGFHFDLDGVGAGQIILNFPRARNILVSHTPYNGDLGLAATILAPNAELHLTEAKITGGVYVGSIQAVNGQVNYAASGLDRACN